jgi:hypothetical protein
MFQKRSIDLQSIDNKCFIRNIRNKCFPKCKPVQYNEEEEGDLEREIGKGRLGRGDWEGGHFESQLVGEVKLLFSTETHSRGLYR